MTFLGFPAVELDTLEPGAADAVILGVPFGMAYPDAGLTAGCAEAPAAVRSRSARLARFIDNHDFELDGPMLPPGANFRVVDAGDVAGSVEDGATNHTAAEAAVRRILAAGAVPIVLGGDDSICIPVLRAYEDHGPISILQVDAHLDFRHEVDGVREGYSSPMRRAAELPHVAAIVQAGLRGVGSARTSDVADARARGNLLVTARELRERGVGWLLERLPENASVFIAFDCDGLDPTVLPAVSGASPGGLTYDEASDLLTGVAGRCRLVGTSFTELIPARDEQEMSALVVVRLAMLLLGAVARRRATLSS